MNVELILVVIGLIVIFGILTRLFFRFVGGDPDQNPGKIVGDAYWKRISGDK